MEAHDLPLRDRLISQNEPTPQKLARYRREVDELLVQVHRRRWWIDGVRAVLTTLGVIVLFPLAILFGAIGLYMLVSPAPVAAALPVAVGLACLAGGTALLWWFFRRRSDNLLLEVKRLQAQGLELEEQLRPQDGR